MNKNILFFLTFFVLFLSACDKDDDPVVEPMNIVETAIATDDLSSLVEALQATNLVSALEAAGPFTVFAPTNAAFQTLLDSNPDWNTIADIPTATLTDVLLFHVVSGKVQAADLTDTYVPTLSTGPDDEAISLQIAVSNGVRFNGTTQPVSTDIQATNGVVHIVNSVMLPPAIPNHALNNPAFSTLVLALTDTRHTVDYISLLSSAGPFTVFAPNNTAFGNLLSSNPDWNSLGDIPIATLEAVLNYHVFNGLNVTAGELTNGQQIEMYSGNILTVDLTEGAKLNTSGGQTGVNIVLTDVQGTNGVVHVVDEVLLP